jgi:hypothetical protein
MRPKERRDSGQSDFFRTRLDQIVDLGHLLARLASAIDWRFLESGSARSILDRDRTMPRLRRQSRGKSKTIPTAPGNRNCAGLRGGAGRTQTGRQTIMGGG